MFIDSLRSFQICFILLAVVAVTGCSDTCEVENSYIYMEPVYTSIEEIRSSIEVSPARDINQAGQIFFKDNYLFINEPNEGIHIINNQDASNPVNEAFIAVPGSFDLVVRGNTLLTDSYIDLVALDITDFSKVTEIARLEGFFNNYNSYGHYFDPQRGVVTDWKEVGMVDISESDCNGNVIHGWGFYDRGIALESIANFSAEAAVAPSNPGVGGSMARFTLSGSHLYAIDLNQLKAVDVSNPSNMTAGRELEIDWDIETLFPKNDLLFVGARSGMHIINIENPIAPELISTYEHVSSCDPVIVENNLAYVTLRSGTQCQGFTNQLEVIDITNLNEPELLHTYNMTNPHGLGKDGDALFICDGKAGLRVFDASDISKIGDRQLFQYENIEAVDIIPFNNTAMTIAKDGLYQYDYSDMANIQLLSQIKIVATDD